MTDAISGSVAKRVLHKFTDEQRTQLVAESFREGARVADIARRHGIRPNLLSYWRMLSRTTGQTTKTPAAVKPATLARVRVMAPTRAAVEGVIEIDLASGCVRVRGSVEGAMLREVLAAVR